jgi:predicted DNA-binding transcriptional regulator AlpA
MMSAQLSSSQTFLQTKEVAQLLGISKSTVEKHRCHGTGPKYSKLGRKVVYAPADVNEWIRQNARRSTSGPSTPIIPPTKSIVHSGDRQKDRPRKVNPVNPVLDSAIVVEADTAQPALLNTTDAARFLNVSYRSLEKLRYKNGRGPKFIKHGRNVFYAVSDLNEYAGRNARHSTSEPGTTIILPEQPADPEKPVDHAGDRQIDRRGKTNVVKPAPDSAILVKVDAAQQTQLTPRKAARFLGISRHTLEKLRYQAGKGPKFTKVDRLVYYAIGDLKEWRNGRLATADPGTTASPSTKQRYGPSIKSSKVRPIAPPRPAVGAATRNKWGGAVDAGTELTHVDIQWIKEQVENRIRFGRIDQQHVIDREWRVVSFSAGSIFAFVRWTGNAHGTVESRIDILRAVVPGERYITVPDVHPGGESLLRISGWPKVEKVLQTIDAIEALRIDPADVGPDYWRHVHNRLSVGDRFQPYSWTRHRAWLHRQQVSS